jgi:hypothetical protein
MVKIAAFAPMPNASVPTASRKNPGLFRKKRKAYRRSWISVGIGGLLWLCGVSL